MPPIVPSLRSPNDCRYIDKAFLSEDINETPFDKIKKDNESQGTNYEALTYVKAHALNLWKYI